ncbi:uncharacterized protein BJX67DRAFT_381110 [Aspergillus lucknowensis]|uniref:Uncharacterized protein n=1 Tax=Aspergillus lucknowensis TaxID=176173 RepID=A0ABR4LTE8_9EURO
MYARAISLLAILPLATAICPGYNYAFFEVNGWHSTTTVDCTLKVSGNCDNVCDCQFWGCGLKGSVNRVLVNGLWYDCRNDANKGKCGPEDGVSPPAQLANRAPESCCRNDGGRNLEEGRIGPKRAAAIEETNAILDRHIEEYEQASEEERAPLQRRHALEIEEAMKREAAAGALDV